MYVSQAFILLSVSTVFTRSFVVFFSRISLRSFISFGHCHARLPRCEGAFFAVILSMNVHFVTLLVDVVISLTYHCHVSACIVTPLYTISRFMTRSTRRLNVNLVSVMSRMSCRSSIMLSRRASPRVGHALPSSLCQASSRMRRRSST